MSYYERWLTAEKEWIGTYCSETKKKSLCRTVPMVLIVLTAIFGLMPLMGGTAEDAMYGAFGGFMLGLIVCAIYLLILLPGLNPKRYVKKVEAAVKALNMAEAEREQLGREMLETDAGHIISYVISAPGSKGTPARFVKTPHYAYLAGSSPYAILVRLSDVEQIVAGQEQKDMVQRGAKTKTYYKITLYTIGFFRRDRAARGLTENDYPDEAMGFFQSNIRDKALELLSETPEY